MTKSAPEVLRAAADRLEAIPRLNKAGSFHSPIYKDGELVEWCHCTMGAVLWALNGGKPSGLVPTHLRPTFDTIATAISLAALGKDSIYGIFDWNDNECSGKEETATLLRRVADGWPES